MKEMVQAWWMDNMPGQELPVFSGNISVGFNRVCNRVEEYSDTGQVDKGFWDPHTDTKYDSVE